MRKPLGRLAGAVVAGALITAVVMPAAYAEEDPSAPMPTPTSELTETPTPSSPATTTSNPSSSASTTTPDSPSSSASSPSATTTSPGNTSGSVSTTSSKPTETSSGSPSTTPEEPPYEDNVGYGVDLGDSYGVLIIACAAGKPTGVTSDDFVVLDGPYQEEQDGRYWDYLVQLNGGKTFASGEITADWMCGSNGGGGASGGGVPVAPVAGSDQAAAWQASNGGKAQVRFAPSAGVETGFGGTAQD